MVKIYENLLILHINIARKGKKEEKGSDRKRYADKESRKYVAEE